MAEPVVSVLIDTYNYGQFVEEAIESVLTQEFPAERLEVVVVDDGSTDDTAARVRRFGRRVRYFHKANGGQASAFDFGFARARGEIIALLDADDYFLPGKLRRVVEEFERRPEAGMVYHARKELHAETGRVTEPAFSAVTGMLARDEYKLLRYDLHPTSCLAFRRSALEKVLPIPESLRLQADGHLDLLLPLVAPVAGIAEALTVYRVHGRNLFFADAQSAAERHRRWAASFEEVVKQAEGWVRAHERELRGVRTRRYFAMRRLLARQRRFLAEPPGRLRYFGFVVYQNYVCSKIQTRRYTALKYLSAPWALALGYGGAGVLERWQGAAVKGFRSALKSRMR